MAARHDNSPTALAVSRQRRALKRVAPNAGLTPRVKLAIEHFVHGLPNQDPGVPVTMERAAEAAGFTARAFRAALRKPNVLSHYQAELRAFRQGQQVANLRTLVEIRDDPALRGQAAGATARIKSVSLLDPELSQPHGGTTINVGVKVETPGYVLDLTEPTPRGAPLDLEDRG